MGLLIDAPISGNEPLQTVTGSYSRTVILFYLVSETWFEVFRESCPEWGASLYDLWRLPSDADCHLEKALMCLTILHTGTP